MSRKRSAPEDSDSEMTSKHASKKYTVHPFFNQNKGSNPHPFKWLAPLGDKGTCLHGIHLTPTLTSKIAAFDLDGTIITPKSGGRMPKNHEDWMFWKPQVIGKLKQLHQDGFSIVLISNQLAPNASKPMAHREEWKKKLPLIATGLPQLPFRILAATARDGFRKPMPGMWMKLEDIYSEASITIDKTSSFFVGDAAGRPNDHASTDRKWALNIGIPFFTPEEYFLGWAPVAYKLTGFHPSTLPVDLPLFNPTSTPLVPENPTKPEIVLFVGYPATGKTSFYRKHFQPAGYGHVNQDSLKTKAKCLKAVEAFIKDQKSCVVDNTNRDKKTRRDYFDLASKYAIAMRCIYFKASLELAHHNNLYRAFCLPPDMQAIEGKRPLLDYGAFTSFKADLEEPDNSEGFTEIKHVNWSFTGDERARFLWDMWLQI